jgi:BirA family biotin operon repressor/biotin-[acetyl-CoA-carboxylase] ligase
VSFQRTADLTVAAAPPLSQAALERWLEDAAFSDPIAVAVQAQAGSTNEELLLRCRVQQPASVQLLAVDEQTAGRGRQRRPWHARPRSALLFSLAVPLPELLPGLPAITPSCGAALAEALIARGVSIGLKWPNDLMLEGRKLGGVLCELAVDDYRQATLVLGVGINISLTAEDRAQIGQPAAALDEVLSPRLLAGEREAWIAALAASMLAMVRRFSVEGFAPWRARCNELLQSRGELVAIVDDGRAIASGRVVEVDAQGRLVLQTASGPRAIQVGDVSVRPPGVSGGAP